MKNRNNDRKKKNIPKDGTLILMFLPSDSNLLALLHFACHYFLSNKYILIYDMMKHMLLNITTIRNK